MKRKMVLIFVDADHAEEVERLLESCELPGYSEVPNVLGKGATGKKFGSRAFPGSSTLYIAAVDEMCEKRLGPELRKLVDTQGPEKGLKVYSMDTEEVL